MDTKKKVTVDTVKENIESKLTRYFGVKFDEATDEQIYKSVVLSVKDILTLKRSAYRETIKKAHPKKVYYMCMEFLMGRQLRNNLMNLGIADEYRAALSDVGFDLDK
ncbi:MAG: alpha-glucan phosphorylase, partial [Clostridia bacterium]|nr:alpha-glucan phosphorylase [Clostridia bacterium]